MAFVITQEIQGNECIGDSRIKINSNFDKLDTVVVALSTNTISVSATDTILHTYTPTIRRLASNVRDNSIQAKHLQTDSVTTAKLSAEAVTTDKIAPDTVRYSQLASWQTLSASPTLSAEAVQPRLAKAWVCFNGEAGTYPNGVVSLSGSYNIASVIRVSIGRYRVNFQTPMPDTNYCAVGTIGILGSPASPQGRGVFISSYYENKTTTSFGFHLEQATDGAQLPSHSIDIVFF